MSALRCVLLVPSVCVTAAAFAGDPAEPPPVATTIMRGLDFLTRDAIAWKTEHKCASCHHAALVVWAFREAQSDGYAVDEALLTELNTMMSEAGDGRFRSAPRPADRPKALNGKALYFSLALAANPDPAAVSHEGTQLLLSTVEDDQTEDGCWSAWPETRPPLSITSDDTATSLAVLALLPAAAAGDDDARAARDKGLAWLAATPSDDEPQSLALRVILWSRLARPGKESRAWAERIVSRQNDDGGWSQTPEMASDAWATGQALSALAGAGYAPDDPVISRGREFLVSTQRADGSWPMTSRPVQPGGQGSSSLIPITGAGAAWAVLGLIHSSR